MYNLNYQKGISPFLKVIGYELVILLVYFLSRFIVYIFKLPSLSLDIIVNISLTVLAIWFLSKNNWWKEAGFKKPFKITMLFYFWLPVMLILLNIPSILNNGIRAISSGKILVFIIIAILVGFAQEAFFRGLILKTLISKGIWIATIVSSLFFGLTHLINIFAGANLIYTIIQVAYATFIFGFVGAALLIKTGTILPLVIIHSIIDFLSFLKNDATIQTREISGSDIYVTIILSGICILYGIILLITSRKMSSKVFISEHHF